MRTCCSTLLIFALLAGAASSYTIRNPTKRAGAGPLFQIVRNAKWGFIDRAGRIVVAPRFTDVRDFFNRRAAVESSDGKWGYIDESGTVVIAARFDEVRDFIDELAPVRLGRKWGYIDTSGRMIIEPRFQSAGEFHEGLARVHSWSTVVCVSGTYSAEDAPLHAFHLLEDDMSDLPDCFPAGGKFGYIDKKGALVIEPQFFVALDFAEGLAAVRVEERTGSKYGYIDQTGRMVVAPRFNQAGSFSEGLAAVETSARVVGNQVVDIAWGFIDKVGALRIPDTYAYAGSFSGGLAKVAIRMGVSEGYIDRTGKMVIPARFSHTSNFSDGLAVACADECVYIDRSGSEVLRKFRATWQFSDGLAVIGLHQEQFYIDKRGRRIAPYSDK